MLESAPAADASEVRPLPLSRARTPFPPLLTALLKVVLSVLPQPAGDFTLAQAYEAAHDQAQAAAYYQRVYYLYPLTEFAAQASKAIESLRASMGTAFPPPMPQQMLERGSRLLDAQEYSKARAEFSALTQSLGGAEREIASVRIGAAAAMRPVS